MDDRPKALANMSTTTKVVVIALGVLCWAVIFLIVFWAAGAL